MDSVRNQNNLFDDVPVHGDERDSFDRYHTPEWATKALVDYVRISGTVWEPACGADWIGRVLRKQGSAWTYLGTDLDPEAVTMDYWYRWHFYTSKKRPVPPLDFLTDPMPEFPDWLLEKKLDWIVTNPPYATPTGSATDFVRKALKYRKSTGCSVAMLMRIGWLEPCADRADILTDNPPTDVLVLPRVHYIGAGKPNNQTSAWYIWNGESGETKLKVVSK